MLTIVMSLEQLKNKRFNSTSTDNQQRPTNFYFTTVAFALVFFSHIVNHTIIRLQEELLNVKQKSKSIEAIFKSSGEENEDDDTTETTRLDETDRLSRMSKSSSSSSRDKSPKAAASKKSIRLLYGQRRRKHNSDSDTNESTFEDDERQQRGSRKTTNLRNKNIAKFLDRDNLSETELNNLSDDSDSNMKRKKKKKRRTFTKRSSESDLNSDSDSTTSDSSESSSQSEEEEEPETLPKRENKANEKISTQLISKELEIMPIELPNEVTNAEESQIGSITMNENDLLFSSNSQSISFKEFSTQLHSRLSVLQENSSITIVNNPTASILSNSITSEEFIDNEIYKSVLNGKKQVSIPPGFEKNSKEAEEIEELGKKIATFQIETDTEMSIFNSNSSSSSSDNEAKESQIKCSAADFISREKLHSSCGSKEKNESKSVNKAAKM